jgi:hypothetical protein
MQQWQVSSLATRRLPVIVSRSKSSTWKATDEAAAGASRLGICASSNAASASQISHCQTATARTSRHNITLNISLFASRPGVQTLCMSAQTRPKCRTGGHVRRISTETKTDSNITRLYG